MALLAKMMVATAAATTAVAVPLYCTSIGTVQGSGYVESVKNSWFNQKHSTLWRKDAYGPLRASLGPLIYAGWTHTPIASCEARTTMTVTESKPTNSSVATNPLENDKDGYSSTSKLPPLPPEIREPTKKKKPSKASEVANASNPDSIPSHINLKEAHVTLYQFESCPFCKRVRCCLDFLNIPYKIVEVDPIFKSELKFSNDYKKVPQLLIQSDRALDTSTTPTEEEIKNHKSALLLRDSMAIVHMLLVHEGAALSDNEAAKIQQAWIKWVDAWLVQIVVMNIYRTLKESAETFQYILTHPDFSWFKKFIGASSGTIVMWLVSRQRRKNYSIQYEREALYNALNDFIDAVGNSNFLGGDQPNECDLAVFGILLSIKGFKAEKDVFDNTKIKRWYDLMVDQIGASKATNLNKC